MDDLKTHRRIVRELAEPARVVYADGVYLHEDEITLADLWRVVWRYRWLIVAGVLLGAAAAGAAAWLMTPYYRAAVVMMPAADDEGGNLSALQRNLGDLVSPLGMDLGGLHHNRDWMVATLKSQSFTEDFIQRHGLLPVLFASRWDAAHKRWRDPGRVPTLWDGYKLFKRRLRGIDSDRSSGLITLSVEWKAPRLAASWANDMVSELNRRLQDDAVHDAQRSIAYLRGEARKTDVVELRQAIFRLIESEIKKTMVAKASDEYAFKVIDPAHVPEEPVSPKPLVMVVLGLILGLIVGLFLAFILNLVRRSGTGGSDVAAATQT